MSSCWTTEKFTRSSNLSGGGCVSCSNISVGLGKIDTAQLSLLMHPCVELGPWILYYGWRWGQPFSVDVWKDTVNNCTAKGRAQKRATFSNALRVISTECLSLL